MKNRIGFVSNSSSASFIIQKKDITEEQLDQIRNHFEESKKISEKDPEYPNIHIKSENYAYPVKEYDAWNIDETETEIKGVTYMDNFDMHAFLCAIGVKNDVIEWGSDN